MVRTRRLWGLFAVAAFATQMALPALHAGAVARLEGRRAAAHEPADAGPSLAATDAAPAPAHDPATCSICQTVRRTSRDALPPGSCADLGAASAAAPVAPPAPARAAPVRSGSSPRAPPTPPLFLV